MPKNYYSTLALPQNATEEQIRARFRDLARQRHPDRFQGEEKARAEGEFQAITEAFNILSNPERRRLHDLDLARGEAPAPADTSQVARVYLQRGIKAYREKNYLEAADNFDRATKADPTNAQAWHHLALACSHQRRWLSQATAAAAKACELKPMNTSYLKLAGRVFGLAGMTLKAEQYYNEALKWGGEDASISQALDELRAAKKGKSGLFGKTG
jgi:molecular chaperone DnaJ